MKNFLKTVFRKASFALEVAEAPVRGHGNPDQDGLLCFDLQEPKNSHSTLSKYFSGDGSERFFSTNRNAVQKMIKEAHDKNEPLFIVASPFVNKKGCHNVWLAMNP